MSDCKSNLLGLTLEEIKTAATDMGMASYRGAQIARWLYQRHVEHIDEMTDLSLEDRRQLAGRYDIGCRKYIKKQTSADGTVKYLFPTADGQMVETVYIPDGDRATLCVSTQVGCKMNCRFCYTGRQGFHGNLTVTDLLNQIYSLSQHAALTNIVFMGQGEPMDNFYNLMKTLQILTAPYGYAWSPKRITVSSVGIRGRLKEFLDNSRCHLAISLHSPFPEERAALMPAEKAMSIIEVVDLLRQYDFSHQRRLSFEYIMFDGLNDNQEHADRLLRLLRGLDCRINLIAFHPFPGTALIGSSEGRMLTMRNYLTHHGVFTTIRASRGQDIYAACGLLSTKYAVR